MRKVVFLLVIFVCSLAAFAQDATQGSLYAVDRGGRELGMCPLRNTSVKADISGFLARVSVRQEFQNSFTTPIEAVYIFPLSQNGAVDDMTMTVGERVVKGKIMRRAEVRTTYETAKAEGKTASLLDQERPNIFTQSVANIMPGERVVIEISYVETLSYLDGGYEFVFPMTVGPRYIPDSVKDAARITPPYSRHRSGSDISIEVNLNAGVPVEEMQSKSHRIDEVKLSPSTARVTLRDGKTIPNKDFVLRYDVTGKKIEDAILTHRDGRGGFFTMILQPPGEIASEDRTPKEIVFVLDTSGSMEGFPIEKAKEAMRLSLEGLYPEDTFNLITFAGDTEVLFERPVPATKANLERAQAFLAEREGSGGTEMMKAIKAALDPSDSSDHLRIVCFMTDGYVGNENEILAEVQKHPNARVFSFGIGDSVNRFLLDKLAEEGNGEAEYVLLEDDGARAARRFYERVRTPLLTDLSIEWNGMPVADIYPNKLTDLFSAKPVTINGRYTRAASGMISLKGKVAGQPYERQIAVSLPEVEAANDVLATLWARKRVDEISKETLKATDSKNLEALNEQVTDIGLEFRLLTEFTSFVAVEDRVVNHDGKMTTVEVPVHVPSGVSSEKTVQASTTKGGGGGGGSSTKQTLRAAAKHKMHKNWPSKTVAARPVAGGVISGSGSGSGSGNAGSAPPPIASPPAGSVQATVNVTSSNEIVTADQSSPLFGTTLNIRQEQQVLPASGHFAILSKVTPGTAKFQNLTVDGSSGPENSFTLDGVAVGKESEELTGKTALIVRPDYPAAARAKKALGSVTVDVLTDGAGNVISAKSTSGNALLWKAAEMAARLSRFIPTYVDGRPVRLSGTIAYNFKSAKNVEVALAGMKALPPTPEDLAAMATDEKLHFWLSALVARVKAGVTKPGPNEARFVTSGRAAVTIELLPSSPAVLDKLKAAGFELKAQKGASSVTGTVAIDKLAALAAVDEVKLILPKI